MQSWLPCFAGFAVDAMRADRCAIPLVMAHLVLTLTGPITAAPTEAITLQTQIGAAMPASASLKCVT